MKEYAGKNIKKAVVLAAGKGERLKPITNAIPKELIRVGKKPTIEHVLNVIHAGGIKDVLVITGWKKHAMIDFLGSGGTLAIEKFWHQGHTNVQDQLPRVRVLLPGQKWKKGFFSMQSTFTEDNKPYSNV